MPSSYIGVEFRDTVADAQPVFKVTKKIGPAVYEAVSQPEYVTINAQRVEIGYAGTVRAYKKADIDRRLQMAKFWEERVQQTQSFWQNQKPGTILHYDNGFAQFVRAEVVKVPRRQKNSRGTDYIGGVALKPLGLVGNWQDMDLPRRTMSGVITLGYWAKNIQDGELFQPNESTVWENYDQTKRERSMRGCRPPTPQQVVNFPKYEKPFDPTAETLIDLTPPQPTAEEKESERIFALREKVNKLLDLSGRYGDDPALTVKNALRDVQTLITKELR